MYIILSKINVCLDNYMSKDTIYIRYYNLSINELIHNSSAILTVCFIISYNINVFIEFIQLN